MNHPPPRIRSYYHLLKQAKRPVIAAEIHLVLASDSKDPRRAVRCWKRSTKGRLHLHSVRGSHDSFIREDAAETVNVLNSILLDDVNDESGPCAIPEIGHRRLGVREPG